MTGEVSDALLGPSAGPELQRYFYALESESGLAFDDSGFLKPRLVRDLLAPQDLLLFKCVIVTAPPWTGKSYVAKGMATWLVRTGSAVTVAGADPSDVRTELTSLEAFVSGDALRPGVRPRRCPVLQPGGLIPSDLSLRNLAGAAQTAAESAISRGPHPGNRVSHLL